MLKNAPSRPTVSQLWNDSTVNIHNYKHADVLTLSTIMKHHRLHGSASPVLTATGFVNGRGQFLTPTESTSLDRSPKNLLLVIMLATNMAVLNLVQIRPWGATGKNGCNITNFFIYLYLSSWTHLQVRPVDGFSRLMAKTMWTRARMWLLGVSLISLFILGVKYP